MAMKGHSTLPRAPELDPHHQMQFNVIPRTFFIKRLSKLSSNAAIQSSKKHATVQISLTVKKNERDFIKQKILVTKLVD